MNRCYFCGSKDVVGIINSDSFNYPEWQVFCCKECISKSSKDKLCLKADKGVKNG